MTKMQELNFSNLVLAVFNMWENSSAKNSTGREWVELPLYVRHVKTYEITKRLLDLGSVLS